MIIKVVLHVGFIMKNKEKKTVRSTYERFISNPERKLLFDKEYQELLISELLTTAMKKDDVSVRELAAEAGVSPTIIQELRSGKRKNITLATFNRVINAIGYEISIAPKNR